MLVLKGKAANKFGARKTILDGQEFDSRKEARRWAELKLLERAGEIRDLERQVTFELIPAQKDWNGKVIERPVKYVADFIYTCDEKNGWKRVVEDVKSEATRTPEYIIKRKLMLERYGIRIKEV